MSLNNTQFLILGMINQFEKTGVSGKKLNELIIERNVRDWADIGFSSIYYVLDQLEKKDYLKSYSEKLDSLKKGAPQKKYKITKKTKRTLIKTVKDYLNRERLTFKELNLALASSYILSQEEMIEHFNSYKERLNDRLAKVESKYSHNGSDKLPIHVWALFNHSFCSIKAEIDFLDKLIDKYRTSNNL
jgi:DNA-binding PadR family transcriptional regulator